AEWETGTGIPNQCVIFVGEKAAAAVRFARRPVEIGRGCAADPEPDVFLTSVVEAEPERALDVAERAEVGEDPVVFRRVVDGGEMTAEADGDLLGGRPVGRVEKIIPVAVGGIRDRAGEEMRRRNGRLV